MKNLFIIMILIVSCSKNNSASKPKQNITEISDDASKAAGKICNLSFTNSGNTIDTLCIQGSAKMDEQFCNEILNHIVENSIEAPSWDDYSVTVDTTVESCPASLTVTIAPLGDLQVNKSSFCENISFNSQKVLVQYYDIGALANEVNAESDCETRIFNGTFVEN